MKRTPEKQSTDREILRRGKEYKNREENNGEEHKRKRTTLEGFFFFFFLRTDYKDFVSSEEKRLGKQIDTSFKDNF